MRETQGRTKTEERSPLDARYEALQSELKHLFQELKIAAGVETKLLSEKRCKRPLPLLRQKVRGESLSAFEERFV